MTCPDASRIQRGCTRPLAEPEHWDYDPDTRTIGATGEVVPTTCPVLVDRDYPVFVEALALAQEIDRGLVGLQEIPIEWYTASLAATAAVEQVAQEGRRG